MATTNNNVSPPVRLRRRRSVVHDSARLPDSPVARFFAFRPPVVPPVRFPAPLFVAFALLLWATIYVIAPLVRGAS